MDALLADLHRLSTADTLGLGALAFAAIWGATMVGGAGVVRWLLRGRGGRRSGPIAADTPEPDADADIGANAGPVGATPHAKRPTCSVLVAARDEEAAIGDRIDNLLALQDPGDGVEIIVISDGSTDATADIVRARAALAPADRPIRLLELSPNRGKEAAVGIAAEAALGDWVALTDATTVWQPDVLRQFATAFADARVGAVSGRVLYRKRDGGVADGFAAYQRFVVRQRAAGAAALQVSTSGACSAIRARCLKGYVPNMNSDLQLFVLAAEHGLGTAYVGDAVAWEEPRTSLGEELRARQRIMRLCLVSIPPMFARLSKARAHGLIALLVVTKLTRWLIWLPALAVCVGLASLATSDVAWLALGARAALAATLGGAVVGVARLRGWRIGGPIGGALGYATLAVVATASALWQVAQGQRALTWRPERSGAPL